MNTVRVVMNEQGKETETTKHKHRAFICISLSPDKKLFIQTEAEKYKMSVSRYIRGRICGTPMPKEAKA